MAILTVNKWVELADGLFEQVRETVEIREILYESMNTSVACRASTPSEPRTTLSQYSD